MAMVKVKLRSVPWAVNADDRIVSKSKNTFTGTRTRSRRRIVRRYFWSLAFAVCVSLAALLVNWFYPDRGDVPRSFLKHCSGGLNQLRQQQPVLGTSTAKEKQQSSEPVRQQAVACRYHGNCPEATACSSRGLCLPYYLHQYTHRHYPTDKNATAPTAEDISHELCVQTCVRELTVEEGFQYGSIPVVQWTSVAAAPHLGCVVNFRRERRLGGLDNWSERPSMAFRIAQRWRSVARIDFSGQRDHWTALCNQPCITDQDCPEHGLACLGRRAYEPPPKLPRGANRTFAKNCQTKTLLDRDMLVVTGADHLYYEPLRNFAASLRYWAPARKLVIYNLGMSESELQHVQSWPNVHAIHWKDGFPSSLPSHVVDNLHNYAWKSLVINETVHEYKSIFWLDAGVTLVGPIEPIEEITHQHGLFLVKGQDGNMTSTSHPATYRWHGYDKNTYQAGPHFAGGIQGHVYPSRYIDSIVIPNAKCALDPDCISPKKSSTIRSHRFDQTSLSILAYQYHIRAPCYTEFLAGGRDQLHRHGENLDKASTPFIFWTSRGGCTFYTRNHGL